MKKKKKVKDLLINVGNYKAGLIVAGSSEPDAEIEAKKMYDEQIKIIDERYNY